MNPTQYLAVLAIHSEIAHVGNPTDWNYFVSKLLLVAFCICFIIDMKRGSHD